MTGLVEWLHAQFDEDERLVRLALGSTIGAQVDWNGVTLWSARRALAEVAAKRAIIDHEDMWGEDDHIARLLAQPYADRPGYRQEWAPW